MHGESALPRGSSRIAARRSRAVAENPGTPICPVCALARRGAAPNPWAELADPAHRRAGAGAIADHLGFCARHAAALGGKRWPRGFAAVASEACLTWT